MAVALTAGVDLGGTKIQTVVLRSGKVAGQARVLTPAGSAEEMVNAITETVASAAEEARGSIKSVTALGIGFPGSVDPGGKVTRAVNLPAFEGYDQIGRASCRERG